MKELLKALIEAESTPDKGELAAAEVVSAELRRSAIDSCLDLWDSARANVVARIKSDGSRPGLLFACHLDVVGPGETPWRNPPFEALEADGRIYGRGAVDMKGGTAAAITAIRRVVESAAKLRGDIIFVASAGEEVDSCGAIRFAAAQERPGELAGVIIPEPTDFDVVSAHRGMLWLEVETRGRAAHSSRPELGVNAINSMRLILNELDRYEIPAERHELLGNCSMSVNTITGGKALNVVPDRCSIRIDIRTLPGQDSRRVVDDFRDIFARLRSSNTQFDAEVSVKRTMNALETDCDCEFVRDFCSCVGARATRPVGFTTDGPHFVSFGAPVLIFGPGKPHLCHKPDEYIDIRDLEKAAEHYENIILKFLT
ncbi:MAG: M20 family metallopeptidase [Planctomycetota bacterium]|jgi:succinyl-diaminopimelate desuccinylase